MDYPKIVLGLKAEKRYSPSQDDTSDDGNFFSTSSSDGANLLLARTTPVVSITPPEMKQKILGFSEASARITQITNSLKDFKIEENTEEKIYLIPEGVLCPDDAQKIDDFIENRSENLDLVDENFDDIFAQSLI